METTIRSILIGGCGSSGTSLLAHLLNATNSIFCGPELDCFNKLDLYTKPFEYTLEEFRELMDYGIPTTGNSNTDLLAPSTHRKLSSTRNFMMNIKAYGYSKDQVCEIAENSRDFNQFADKFYAPWLKETNKIIWAEKTPTNAYCIREFLSLFDHGRYLHIVRDGRDVVLSLMKRGFNTEASVRRWLHDTALAFPYRKNKKCLIIRYEDLVTKPEFLMRSIFRFLNISENPGDVIEKAKHTEVLTSSLDEWTVFPNQEISNKAMFKWRRHDYHDKKFIEQLFRHTFLNETIAAECGLPVPCNGNLLLLLLGYDPFDGWDSSPKLGPRFLWHYFQEFLLGHLRPRRLYCFVSLS
jgi:hypothetical protein